MHSATFPPEHAPACDLMVLPIGLATPTPCQPTCNLRVHLAWGPKRPLASAPSPFPEALAGKRAGSQVTGFEALIRFR